MKAVSKSALYERQQIIEEIKRAVSFSAHLRIGPHEKYTTRDIKTAQDALDEADRLTKAHSRFGRKAAAFAISARGAATLCTEELLNFINLGRRE